VHLQVIPTGTATVTVGSSDTSQVGVAPQTLTFTAADYDKDKPVTLTAQQDDDAVDGGATVNATSPGAAPGATKVTVIDDDVLGIAVSSATLAVDEQGTATLKVHLTAKPTATVTVDVASNDPGAATATTPLTFTSNDWNLDQAVTVTGVDDADAVDEHPTLKLSATGLVSQTVAVTVKDNDIQDLVVAPTSVQVDEGSKTGFNVHLAADPLGTVTVTITSTNPASASVVPTTLTFDSSNYTKDQGVTVVGEQDVNLVNEAVPINVTASGFPTHTVIANTIDHDTQSIAVAPGSLTIPETGSGAISVHLAFQPATNVVVTVASGNTGVATISAPASGTLTFTPANYATNQTATVAGVTDADLLFDTTSVSFTSGTLATQVPVTVIEPTILAVAPTSITACVGKAGDDVGVKLAGKPPSTFVVNNTSSAPTVVEINTTSLTFTTLNFGTVQALHFTCLKVGSGVITVNPAPAFYLSRTVNVTCKAFDPLTC
jgi:hypothetical protein